MFLLRYQMIKTSLNARAMRREFLVITEHISKYYVLLDSFLSRLKFL